MGEEEEVLIESKLEKLANKIQLLFFIVDACKDKVEVDKSLLKKAEDSLPQIQQLIRELEKELTNKQSKKIEQILKKF